MKKLIIISGPTACGKTSTAISLAQQLQGEVVNFDSLLFYRELNIGTAKPSVAERAGVPHHLLDICSALDPINAAQFVPMAQAALDDVFSRSKIPILTGGSGFYLQALMKGMWDSPTTPPDVLMKSQVVYDEKGIAPFIDVLRMHDPVNAERLHPNDHYRIRRAVEHFWAHGVPFSQSKASGTTGGINDWETLHLHLDVPRPEHWEIIQRRTDAMIKNGLVDEVRGLLQKGFEGDEKPLQSIGYKETLDWIRGEFPSEADYRERLCLNTRRLAKAQRTWFQKVEKTTFHPLREQGPLLQMAQNFLR